MPYPSRNDYTPSETRGRASPDIPLLLSKTPRSRKRSSSLLSSSTSSASFSTGSPKQWHVPLRQPLSELPYLQPPVELEFDDESGSNSDSSIDLDTPFAHIMMRDGYISPRSRVVAELVPPSSGPPGSRLSTASTRTTSGWYRDERDTLKRRHRHRDGNQLRGGIGLTTGLGWSDSEDEGAPSVLTRRLSSMVSSRRSSKASSFKSSFSVPERSLSRSTVQELHTLRRASPSVSSLRSVRSPSSMASSSRPVTPESVSKTTPPSEKLAFPMPVRTFSMPMVDSSVPKPTQINPLRKASLPAITPSSTHTTITTSNSPFLGFRPLQLPQNTTLGTPPLRLRSKSSSTSTVPASAHYSQPSSRLRTYSESTSSLGPSTSKLPTRSTSPNPNRSPSPLSRPPYTGIAPPKPSPILAQNPKPKTTERRKSRVGSGMMYIRSNASDANLIKQGNPAGLGAGLKRLDTRAAVSVELRIIPPSPGVLDGFHTG